MKRPITRSWLTLPLLALSLNLGLFSPALQAQSLTLPEHSSVPGGVALIPLSVDGASAPEARYGKNRVLVVPSAGTEYAEQASWVALVGIPLSTKPGPQQLNVGSEVISFDVVDKHYREQRLVIKNKRKVNPNKLDLDRIGKEKKKMLAALGNWGDSNLNVIRFARPAKGPFSSPFGLKRFFNDQPRKPHSGLDIAAPKGTPIVAPAPGIVTDTGDYFFNGRNLILDHGQGLITMYSHMNRIDVEVGQRVELGQQLGTVGSSGRVTGPHLHWSVSLNNVRVDPILFLYPDQR
ncbi:peptidoglycan DD-metalloendopeptidase family protein [Motiliproteus sp.]|uniref:peptidoglycan DD-metalloendopeptidase family protein n=1 Tax=Motiliproteus sp. TaxID=1898955 RepID=UPI003BAD5F63